MLEQYFIKTCLSLSEFDKTCAIHTELLQDYLDNPSFDVKKIKQASNTDKNFFTVLCQSIHLSRPSSIYILSHVRDDYEKRTFNFSLIHIVQQLINLGLNPYQQDPKNEGLFFLLLVPGLETESLFELLKEKYPQETKDFFNQSFKCLGMHYQTFLETSLSCKEIIVYLGKIHFIKMFQDLNINVNDLNLTNRPLLAYAKTASVYELLINMGAKENINGINYASYFIKEASSGEKTKFNKLFKKGIGTGQYTYKEVEAMFLSSSGTSFLNFLKNNKININIYNHEDNLFISALKNRKEKNLKKIELLLDNGFDLNLIEERQINGTTYFYHRKTDLFRKIDFLGAELGQKFKHRGKDDLLEPILNPEILEENINDLVKKGEWIRYLSYHNYIFSQEKNKKDKFIQSLIQTSDTGMFHYLESCFTWYHKAINTHALKIGALTITKQNEETESDTLLYLTESTVIEQKNLIFLYFLVVNQTIKLVRQSRAYENQSINDVIKNMNTVIPQLQESFAFFKKNYLQLYSQYHQDFDVDKVIWQPELKGKLEQISLQEITNNQFVKKIKVL